MAGHGETALRVGRLVRFLGGPAALGVLATLALHSQQPTGPGAAAVTPQPRGSVIAHCDARLTADTSLEVRSADTMAVVRTPRGQVRVVSFEQGWHVYNGDAPGTFLRVCRALPAGGPVGR